MIIDASLCNENVPFKATKKADFTFEYPSRPKSIIVERKSMMVITYQEGPVNLVGH